MRFFFLRCVIFKFAFLKRSAAKIIHSCVYVCELLFSFFLFHWHRIEKKIYSTIQKKILKFFYLKVKIFSKWKCKNVFMFNFFILFFFSSPLIRHIYSLHIVDLCIYKTLFFFIPSIFLFRFSFLTSVVVLFYYNTVVCTI